MSWVPFACTVLTPASGLNLALFSVEPECFNRSSSHSSASVNVLVQNCKIYNDASCDISADGQLLAAFIPSSQRGFPDEGILAVYSLAPHNLGEMLYTKRFGKHAARRQGRWVGLWSYLKINLQWEMPQSECQYLSIGVTEYMLLAYPQPQIH